MEVNPCHFESDTIDDTGKHASLALQRALAEVGDTVVRDQRKFDYALLPAELPGSIREKVTKILQERRGNEKAPIPTGTSEAPWQHQLKHHVARLMQQMRAHPQQLRELLLAAAFEPSALDGENNNSTRTFVDAHKAYRRIRRVAMTLGEEIFPMVCKIVRRSEANGILPQAAHLVRLLSLYKLQLRQHVTIRTVTECIQQAYNELSEVHEVEKVDVSGYRKTLKTQTLGQRQVQSAMVYVKRPRDRDSVFSARAATASADATAQNSQPLEIESTSNKITTVHGFKLQAMERLLTTKWQSKRSFNQSTMSNETLAQIQERVTAFLYQNRDNYPLWDEPPLSRKETARYLLTLVTTFLTTPLLQNLTIDQLLEVAKAMKWHVVAPGNTLVVQNTEIDTLYIAMDGSIVSSTVPELNSGSTSCSVMTISAPACFGELGMVRNAERWPQTLTAQYTQGVKILTLPKLTLEILLHRFFMTDKATVLVPMATVHPRRPSSFSARIARQFTKSKKKILSGRRPSTAVPVAAMEANVVRWHKVRDEVLQDFRAGVEAEQRMAALKACQSAMDELSASIVKDDVATISLAPRECLKSHHETLLESILATDKIEELHEYRDLINELKQDSPCLQTCEETVSSSDIPNQLREYYRALSLRRSIVSAQQATSAPLGLMDQPYPIAQKTSEQIPTAKIITSITTCKFTAEKEKATHWNAASEDQPKARNDDRSGSSADSLELGPLSKDLISVKRSHLSGAPSINDSEAILSFDSLIKSSSASRAQILPQESSDVIKDSDAILLRSNAKPIVREATELNPCARPFKDQVENRVANLCGRESIQTDITQKVLCQSQIPNTSALPCSFSQPSGNIVIKAASSELHQHHNHATVPQRANLQQRMDSILDRLQLPPSLKRGIGLKYAHADHCDRFPMAVLLWERVQQSIAQREIVMTTLWDFEMLASDPRRHFRSISTHRLQEEKERDALFSKLNQVSKSCLEAMDELWQCCGDSVYLGERSYRDKMKRDYTELLYQVEQERLRMIYREIRPCTGPATDNETTRDDPKETLNHSLLGGTLVNGRALSAVAPRRPNYTKNRNSLKLSDAYYARYVREDEASIEYTGISHGSKEAENLNDKNEIVEITVHGAGADPTSTRFRLATPRESIFVPVSLQDESSTLDDMIMRGSQVNIQGHQQRQIGLLAFNRLRNQKQKGCSVPHSSTDAVPLSQAIRPPEQTVIATRKSMKKARPRQEHRVPKRLYLQFMTRSNP